MALALAMLVSALLVINLPDRTVGMVARLANQAAMGLLAAPTHGLSGAPVASYGDAMRGLFDDLVAAPWCALNFRTQAFCRGRPDKEAAQEALDAAAEEERPPAGPGQNRRAPAPPPPLPGAGGTRAELWLSFAPGSPPREALYAHYGGRDAGRVGVLGVDVLNTPFGDREGTNPDEVAIQGEAGGLTRLPLLVLIVIGLIGAMLCLGWIGLRLLAQATVGFVLLLLAPVAFLFPALGEAGRSAFASWGLALLGALVSKVIYAALLGVVVVASSLLAGGADDGNWLLAWLLQAALWWTVFLKRDELLGVLTVHPGGPRGGGPRRHGELGRLARVGRDMAGAVMGGAERARDRGLRSRQSRSDAVRDLAREHLDHRTEGRAAQHREDAEDVLLRDRDLEEQLARLDADPDLRAARAHGVGRTEDDTRHDHDRQGEAQGQRDEAPEREGTGPLERDRADSQDRSTRSGLHPRDGSDGAPEAADGTWAEATTHTPGPAEAGTAKRAVGPGPGPRDEQPAEGRTDRSAAIPGFAESVGRIGAGESQDRPAAPLTRDRQARDGQHDAPDGRRGADAPPHGARRDGGSPRVDALERHERLTAERAALAPAVLAAQVRTQAGEEGGGRRDRAVAVEQLRRELALPAHDNAHAWRVGLSPHALARVAREDPGVHAEHVREITAQLARDRKVMRALPSDPRTPPRPSLERPAARELDAERLRELRRDSARRLRHERATRRYLSR